MRKLIGIAILLIVLMCSCTATKLVEVPVENTRIEYIHNTSTDSVFVKDSVDRWLKGDTLYIYKEHTKFKYINKTDTVCKTDTITKVVQVDVVKEVEVNHIYWYQKVLMWAGGITLFILTCFLLNKFKF